MSSCKTSEHFKQVNQLNRPQLICKEEGNSDECAKNEKNMKNEKRKKKKKKKYEK
jgi:hypothetical protein